MPWATDGVGYGWCGLRMPWAMDGVGYGCRGLLGGVNHVVSSVLRAALRATRSEVTKCLGGADWMTFVVIAIYFTVCML